VHEWTYISGERAMAARPNELGVPDETWSALLQKQLRKEQLTGRWLHIWKGWTTNELDSIQYGKLLEKRSSTRTGFDEEWEYDCWIVYMRRGRVEDVWFKETPNEPQPIYRHYETYVPKW